MKLFTKNKFNKIEIDITELFDKPDPKLMFDKARQANNNANERIDSFEKKNVN